MRRQLQPRLNEGGFTLVEAMIVVAIAGILVGFSYAGFTGMLARYRCQGAVNRIAQVLKLAQMKAIEQSTNFFVNLNLSNDTVTITFDNDQCATTAAVVFDQINLAREYPGVNLQAGNPFRFNARGVPKNPIPTNNGPGNTTLELVPQKKPTEKGTVIIDVLGRIRVAAPENWKY